MARIAVHLRRDIDTPLRAPGTWEERWQGADGGLITCWERGREMALDHPSLAHAASAGELVSLPWKGGIAQPIKLRRKYGCLYYLAMWQGLRGQSLDIDTDVETDHTCTRFDVTVVFTADRAKYSQE